MKVTHFVLIALCFSRCREKPPAGANDISNARFDRYKENFVEALWKLYPNWASSVGYHRYDSLLTIPDATEREKELAFVEAQRDSLSIYRVNDLSPVNRTDYLMMGDFAENVLWSINTMKSFEWIPSQYNVCEGFAEMLNNNYDTLDTRLRNFSLKLRGVPKYYAAARSNIKNPTKEHTALAIDQNTGGLSIFGEELQAAVKRSSLSDGEKKLLAKRTDSAVKAINDYVAWLKALDLSSARDFRLGKLLYADKFRHNIPSRFSADEIYIRALDRKKELHEKMSGITKDLWPRYFGKTMMPQDALQAIRKLIDTLSARHVKPDSFQLAIEKQIPELVAFVNSRKLIYLDPSKPLVVRKEPAYMAGIAGASINSPGPYDKKGNTYYNVGSLKGWNSERAESYLREYNHWILQILNIHEAIPGHYVQLIYSNNAPSIIKSIFGNGAMVEGWAVYSELMMLENGYGAREGAPTAEPEMWLMYYKWNLRSTCNTILDYSVHNGQMSREEALKLLTEEAFQQKAEAEGKWKRVTLSQVQLCSYFTGFTEIRDLREEMKNKLGSKFDLKTFHEKFLAYGSAPVKYIRELMLAEAGK
jgi:hypothetical protein